jgi:hypothetical protein
MVSERVMRHIGGNVLAAVDGFVEGHAEWYPAGWYGKGWPVEPLPSVDDWLVAGSGLAILLLGHYMRSEMAKRFGEGATLYAVPMLVHEVMVRAAKMAAKPTAVAAAPPTPVYVPPAPTPVPAPQAPAAMEKIY